MIIQYADNHDIISVRVYDVDDNSDEPDFEVIIGSYSYFSSISDGPAIHACTVRALIHNNNLCAGPGLVDYQA